MGAGTSISPNIPKLQYFEVENLQKLEVLDFEVENF